MTPGSPLLFPPSRAIAGWWHALAPWRPQAFWISHLFLHHVEALVRVAESRPVDRFDSLLLQALLQAKDRTLRGLDRQLHVGPQFLHQALQGLAREQLASPDASGAWAPTAAGRRALADGSHVRCAPSRQVFHFLEPAPRPGPPEFLELTRPRCNACVAGPEWRFDPAHLGDCIRRPVEWKRLRSFPMGVQEILLTPEPEDSHQPAASNNGSSPAAAPWQHVVLDRPEHLVAAIVRGPAEEGKERMLGFEARPDGWGLAAALPVFTLHDWPEILPELAEEPPLERWRESWRDWCQHQAIGAADAESCDLRRHDRRLEVTAPPNITARVRAQRGEVWLLAGTGRTRTAALVEVHESGSA